jgi:sn-glycerol 3-phosphate transport system permease protein
MIERTPIFDLLTHVILLTGLVLMLAPFWLVLVAATVTLQEVNQVPLPLLPGDQLWANLAAAWAKADFGVKLINSLVTAAGVAAGKVLIAAVTAFSIVFFRYRLRMVCFWLIFATLMLPLEVRIVPTYAVAANALQPVQTLLELTGVSWLWQRLTGIELTLHWSMLNSYTGLILPLVATATGTFLYRQFFLTVPAELVEAAKLDGTSPLRFFVDILLPLSRTNMAALTTIMFVYAWNQYLWPILVTTDPSYGTAVSSLKRLMPTFGGTPEWNVAMAGTLITMVPPLLVVVLMQRWFVRGLIATEK